MTSIKIYRDIINNFHNDVKAEAIAAELLEDGLGKDSMITSYNGQHSRAYRRDIETTAAEKKQNGKNYLVMYLNRDSVYDTLPEAFFHEPKIYRHEVDAKIMAADYRERVREVQEARTFFSPIDHELFLQKVFIEQQEKQLLQQLEEYKWDNSLLDFLQIPALLPGYLRASLLACLPYCSTVAGNRKLTQECLSEILREDVWIDERYIMSSSQSSSMSALGTSKLGLDMVTGDSLAEYEKIYEINIGPLTKGNLMNYIANGTHYRFVKTFCSFFIPVETDVVINILVETKSQSFELDEMQAAGRLGFTSTL